MLFIEGTKMVKAFQLLSVLYLLPVACSKGVIDDSNGTDCDPDSAKDNATTYPGPPKILGVQCMTKSVNDKRRGILVHWTLPPKASPTLRLATVFSGPGVKQNFSGIIGGAVTGGVLFVALIIIYQWHKSRKQQHQSIPQSSSEADYIYVSYYPGTRKAIESVLGLVARLRGHGINVNMDALCQREIDQLGMPRWYHSHLEAAKKIILVISKGYLKVFQKWKNRSSNTSSDPSERKIFFELEYISTDIFTRRSAEKLLIVLADVRESEIPSLLKARCTYVWPKGTTEEARLVHAISGTEDITTA